ncbi:MAG TPA: hypothetical protein DEF51_51175, partial [Myxococcales bacterium]|nr:hypothetical protein [Myxococcales bacterium]
TGTVEAAPASEPSADVPEIGVVGEISPELMLGLTANGIAAFVLSDAEPIDASTRALYAPGADEATLRALSAHGLPIVTDHAKGDIAGLTARLAAGAADVVLRPVAAADLAHKLLRVTRDG